MRKIHLSLMIILVIIINSWPGSQAVSASGLQIDAAGAVLIDEVSGQVLYAKNPHLRLFPASTTKVMTALVILENTDMEEEITIGQEILYIGRRSSHAGLRVGEVLSVSDLLMALMLPSGNDAAYSSAVYVARKVSGNDQMPFREALDYFSMMMNQRARELGAVNSNFVNPDGWHDPQHYTTAMDLAIISRQAMTHPYFRTVAATRRYTRDRFVGDEEPVTRVWLNTNRLILAGKDSYPHATGLKTGYTTQAGSCLVASASLEGVNLIAVTLKSGSGQRWQEAARLLDYGLKNFQTYSFTEFNQVLATLPLKGQAEGEPGEIDAITTEGFSDLISNGDANSLTMEFRWEKGLLDKDGYVTGPVSAGEPLGLVVWKTGNKVLFETRLVASGDVKATGQDDQGGLLGVSPVVPGGISLAGLVAAGVVFKRKRQRSRFSRRRGRRLV